MNILFILFVVRVMASEISKVSLFGHFPYSVTFHYFFNMESHIKFIKDISLILLLVHIINIQECNDLTEN